jgi:mono/diheme cytochrome c family protein
MRRSGILALALCCLLPVAGGVAAYDATEAPQTADLPLPSTLPLIDYEEILFPWIARRDYAALDWRRDKSWRDTGPFVFDMSFGVHPAVRMYYSPEIIDWLEGGRAGPVADGAIVIKEMVDAPAARYNEHYADLAAQYPDDPEKLAEEMADFVYTTGGLNWTVMVKDSSVSHGGWFFASVYFADAAAMQARRPVIDDFAPPYSPPLGAAGDGMCMRCHASAAEELIFSALENIEGYPGEPVIFRVDESWRDLPASQKPAFGATLPKMIQSFLDDRHDPGAMRAAHVAAATASPVAVNPDFLAMFPATNGIYISRSDLQTLPSEWLDHVPARPNDTQHFLTSDNCVGCHGGLGGAPSGVTMFVKTGPNYGDGYNISEYGEWRWSPMGLAGRDPIFYAQLESEFALLEAAGVGDLSENLGTTCLSCHGAMGQRQLEIDAHDNPQTGLDGNVFKPDYVLLHDPLTLDQLDRQIADGTFPYHEYGNLAREGISCTVCHHIAPPQRVQGQPEYNTLDTYLMNGTTGVFRLNAADTLIGPYSDVRERPMQNAMGITPVGDDYIKNSELCGACHTINLPNVDAPTDRPLPGYTVAEQAILNQAAENAVTFLQDEFGVTYREPLVQFQHSIEQATFLEWQNSQFADAGTARSCQDCHMKTGFETLDGSVKIESLTTQIASIQDTNLPEVPNALPHAEIEVPFRDTYKRHNFVGLNAFLVSMLSQFDEEMGLGPKDPMTYATNGAQLSMETMALQARDETADVRIESLTASAGTLEAIVSVDNKTGHRLPSGVGFRRAFLELRVTDASGAQVWCSGCTNGAGVIIGSDGAPLKTEFLDVVPPGATEALYQPHHDLIDDQNQVQIYEELTQNADLEFTTSFVHRVHHPKDNRLLPWGAAEPGTPAFIARFGDSDVTAAFMKATMPEGRAADDPGVKAGKDELTYRIDLPGGVDPHQVTVTATLYYQAIPPYYLKQRFETAPNGPATQRLYYLASRLQTEGTLIENWKLKVQGDSATLH